MRTDMLVVPCLTRHVSATSLGALHAADSYTRLWVRSKGDMTNANLPLSFFQLMQFQWVHPPALWRASGATHCAKSSSVPKVQLFLLTHHLANPFCSPAPAVIHKWLRIHYDEFRWYQQSRPTARNSQRDCTRECSRWLRRTKITSGSVLSSLGNCENGADTGGTDGGYLACLTSASRAEFC